MMWAVYVTDMTHFAGVEDLTDKRFAGARRFAAYLGAIVAAATAHPAGQVISTPLPCHRRPGHKACPGRLVVHRSEIPPQVNWLCPSCEEEGVISNWEGCPWDLSPPRSAMAGRRAITMSPRQYALLRGVARLDLDGRRLVAAGVLDPAGRVLVELADEELQDLIDAVTGEASHERTRRRREDLEEVADFLWGCSEAAPRRPVAGDEGPPQIRVHRYERAVAIRWPEQSRWWVINPATPAAGGWAQAQADFNDLVWIDPAATHPRDLSAWTKAIRQDLASVELVLRSLETTPEGNPWG